MAARYTNTSNATRIWLTLTNPETGTTLELAPGESAELDLPADFTDPFLTETAPAKSRTPKAEPAPEATPVTPTVEPTPKDA